MGWWQSRKIISILGKVGINANTMDDLKTVKYLVMYLNFMARTEEYMTIPTYESLNIYAPIMLMKLDIVHYAVIFGEVLNHLILITPHICAKTVKNK